MEGVVGFANNEGAGAPRQGRQIPQLRGGSLDSDELRVRLQRFNKCEWEGRGQRPQGRGSSLETSSSRGNGKVGVLRDPTTAFLQNSESSVSMEACLPSVSLSSHVYPRNE